MIRRMAGYLGLAALAVGAASCGLLEPDPWAERQAALDASRALWEDAGITAYSYELCRECYCALAGDFIVTVEDGTVVRAERPEDSPIPTEELPFVETIDDLFHAVQDAIDEEIRYEAAALVPLSGPD